MAGNSPSRTVEDYSVSSSDDSDSFKDRLIIDNFYIPHKKRKQQAQSLLNDNNCNKETSKKNKKRHSVYHKRNMWNNALYWPCMHKYNDIKNIFSQTQETYIKNKFPTIYIIHFDEHSDDNFLEELCREITQCGSFHTINKQLDRNNFLIDAMKCSSSVQRQKIPIHFVYHSGIINDICIANLKLASYEAKTFVTFVISRTNVNKYCQFKTGIPTNTQIFHNGFEINDISCFLLPNNDEIDMNVTKQTNEFNIGANVTGEYVTEVGTLEVLELQLKEKFTEILQVLRGAHSHQTAENLTEENEKKTFEISEISETS